MMANVTLTTAEELRVKLNLPTEKIRSVMFFESGFPWMGQHPLAYSRKSQCWTAMARPGKWAMIQENQDIYLWAERVDRLRSEYYLLRANAIL